MRLLTLIFLLIAFNSAAVIDKAKFYSVFESNSLQKVEAQISLLQKGKASINKDAFLGAMMMKKAQFMKKPKDKIAIFKEGKTLLEKAIVKRPSNTIYRFLRLAIQENCPKILKYNSHIQSDAKIVKLNYATLDAISKKYIKRYAEKSKALIL